MKIKGMRKSYGILQYWKNNLIVCENNNMHKSKSTNPNRASSIWWQHVQNEDLAFLLILSH